MFSMVQIWDTAGLEKYQRYVPFSGLLAVLGCLRLRAFAFKTLLLRLHAKSSLSCFFLQFHSVILSWCRCLYHSV